MLLKGAVKNEKEIYLGGLMTLKLTSHRFNNIIKIAGRMIDSWWLASHGVSHQSTGNKY